ncbi:replication-relaxation family protein [Cytobacillus purgationiresistens]|uniref:Transcriptional regulator n=1 Tax=Cytobacillus purgationiresistens TaxID=863449 RepID=A0ABU0AKG0_9BACI|nr:replication-relaxation family protein [Cytobacillus purgationiresistens]MDQ0271206.1 putative transcriptional regulator [Cytobacillus purgationiresistens]
MSHNKDTTIVKLGKPKRRVELSVTELTLFKELSNHRILSAQDIHEFYNTFNSTKRSKSSISNRLKRLVETGLLNKVVVPGDVNSKFPQYFYKLTLRGMNVLVEINYLTDEQLATLNPAITRAKPPKLHNHSVSRIVNRIRIQGYQQGFHFHHFRGTEDQPQQQDDKVVADWVFKRTNKVIYLEVDSGYQRQPIIENKILRYLKVARGMTESFSVVFSTIDGTILPHSKEYDRSKRVASLKEMVPPVQDWPDNFSVYIATAERTTELMLRLLQGIDPAPREFREIILSEWFIQWVNFANDYTIKELDKEFFYLDSKRIKELEVDSIIQLERGDHYRNIGVIFAEEGSAHSYQRIRFNHTKTIGVTRRGHPLHELIIVYPDKDAAQRDIHGTHWPNAWFTHMDVWKDSKSANPNFHRNLSAIRKEVEKFE